MYKFLQARKNCFLEVLISANCPFVNFSRVLILPNGRLELKEEHQKVLQIINEGQGKYHGWIGQSFAQKSSIGKQ